MLIEKLRSHARLPLQIICIAVFVISIGGCSSLWKSDSEETEEAKRLKELMTVPDPPDLVREAAVARGMRPITVHGVGLVNSLANTGGPADPSPMRDQLLDEMRHNTVKEPNQILELKDTAMVSVSALIPPGARRGDPLDLKIVVPSRSRTSDLHGGWLLDTRLRHQQILDSTVRQSDVLAMATGSLVTRANHEAGQDASLKTEALILGGGVVQSERKLGLILRPEYQHVKMASGIAEAINQRFFFFDGSTRRGIAKAVEDDYIEIEIHPRYRDNEYRMMAVVLALAPDRGGSSTQQRLTELSQRLGEPATAADAALQLEGIGEDAVPTLSAGAASLNQELRFYAAEALAYLDRREAIEPLEQAIREEPAFRHPALTALQGFSKSAAADALERLMSEASLEARYGAFVALRMRDDHNTKLNGQRVTQDSKLYQIPTPASPAVVASLRRTPEIVLYGDVAPIEITGFVLGPAGLILKPDTANPAQIRISRFRVGYDDQRTTVGNSVADIIQGIGQVGGSYGDIVQVLRVCKAKGFLKDQLAFDPLPKPLRTYYRDDEQQQESVDPES